MPLLTRHFNNVCLIYDVKADRAFKALFITCSSGRGSCRAVWREPLQEHMRCIQLTQPQELFELATVFDADSPIALLAHRAQEQPRDGLK
jgi:hypothetical protein